MTSTQILGELQELGVTVRVNGPNLSLEPGSVVPPNLIDEIRQPKPELILELTLPYSDGQPPPLDRPPTTEQELRRLMDYIADSDTFDAWLDWAMKYTDPAETLRWNP